MAAVLDINGIRDGTYLHETGRISRTASANTWYGSGINRSHASTGDVCVVEVFINGYNSGFGSQYSTTLSTPPFVWTTEGTNSVTVCSLRMGPAIGHAPNAMTDGYDDDQRLQLRIAHNLNNANNGWDIQWRSTVAATFDTTSTGKELKFFLKRVC